MLMGLQAVRNFALSISLLDNNKNGNCPGIRLCHLLVAIVGDGHGHRGDHRARTSRSA